MLRLGARAFRPLAAIGRSTYAPLYAVRRSYSTQQQTTTTSSSDALDNLLKDITSAAGSSTGNITIPEDIRSATSKRTAKDEEEDEDLDLDLDESAYTFKDSTPEELAQMKADIYTDSHYTTRHHDKIAREFPAMDFSRHTDHQASPLKQVYGDVYLHNHTHEPKKVFKFKNVVAKNYRTIARSWPMVRLNHFKYGKDHYVDELYDDLEGTYTWNNQLAYPDGSINLFCGTSSKAAPINVKGDSMALTYDDSLYTTDVLSNKPIRLSVPKAEADSRFPLRSKDGKKDRITVVPEPESETFKEKEVRTNWERLQMHKRPWNNMTHQGRKEDDRVVYDPLTMVRLNSYTTDGKMIERYYYRDELNENNANCEPVGSGDDLEPGYNPKTGLIEQNGEYETFLYRNMGIASSSMPNRNVFFPNYRPTLERVAEKALRDVIPNTDKSAEKPKKVEYKKKKLATNLLEDGVLPEEVRQVMVESFNELVKDGQLKQEDELQYYNDYARLASKAFMRDRTEQYRLNEILDGTIQEDAIEGMWRVDPTFYYKYIKLNLTEGWIRFYVGEQNKPDFDTTFGVDMVVDTTKPYKATELPFVWKYSQYKLSPEDLKAMRSVKWPASLVPPPQNPMQKGDGSPQDQLAEYFEKSYLQFGHQVRFNPDKCFDPEYDALIPPEQKFYKAFESGEQVSDYTGPLDLSSLAEKGATPEELKELEANMRDQINTIAQREYTADVEDSDADWLEEVEAIREEDEETREALEEAMSAKNMLLEQDPDLPDPDAPKPGVQVPLPNRFVQKGENTVLAYDTTGRRVIQEYNGYRLKISGNRVRLIRCQPEATVRFVSETGEIVHVEEHNGPLTSPFVPRSERKEIRDQEEEEQAEADEITPLSAQDMVEAAKQHVLIVNGVIEPPSMKDEDDVGEDLDSMKGMNDVLTKLGDSTSKEGASENKSELSDLLETLNTPKKVE